MQSSDVEVSLQLKTNERKRKFGSNILNCLKRINKKSWLETYLGRCCFQIRDRRADCFGIYAIENSLVFDDFIIHIFSEFPAEKLKSWKF